jgi:hypothetical protein
VSSCCGVYRSAVGNAGPGLSVTFNPGLLFALSGRCVKPHRTRCLHSAPALNDHALILMHHLQVSSRWRR